MGVVECNCPMTEEIHSVSYQIENPHARYELPCLEFQSVGCHRSLLQKPLQAVSIVLSYPHEPNSKTLLLKAPCIHLWT